MKTAHNVTTLAAILIGFGSFTGDASGAVIVTWEQDGTDVTATWSGTLLVILNDTTRDSSSRDFANFQSLMHLNTDSSGLGYYLQSLVGSATSTSLISTFETPSGESLASFGFTDSGLFWNDVHINVEISGSVFELSFDSSRDIIRFSNTDLSTMGADSFSNTLAWTSNTVGDTISYTTVSSVPEPSSLLLLSLGTLGIIGRRRRTS